MSGAHRDRPVLTYLFPTLRSSYLRLSEPYRVASPQAVVGDNVQPYALPRAEGPFGLVSRDVFLSPGNEAGAGLARRVGDASGGVRLDKLRLHSPSEQPAHGVQEVARLRGRRCAPLFTRDDRRLRDLAVVLPAGGFEHVLKDVVALPPRRLRERRPVRGFAVSGDQPLQRCEIGRAHV